MRLILLVLIAASLMPARTDAATSLAETCGPRLIVDYTEDSPDFFVLRNFSEPGWAVQRVEIDLRGSAGAVIFDVSQDGAGVSAYQPYGEAGGTAILSGRTGITDGDSLLNLSFARFEPGEHFAFAVDLDDTLPGGDQTWVSPAEIFGGVVRAVFDGPDGSTAERAGRFEELAQADTGRHETCLIS